MIQVEETYCPRSGLYIAVWSLNGIKAIGEGKTPLEAEREAQKAAHDGYMRRLGKCAA